MDDVLGTIMNWSKKTLIGAAAAAVIGVVGMSSFYIVGGTEYAVERTPSGEMQGIVDAGIHFKVPFLSTVHTYDIFQTVSYVDDDDDNPRSHGTLKRINFADTYGGLVGGTIRYQLSANPELLVSMHRAFANEDNLITSGLKPISKQLLTYTANQLTGENFMQGGQNEYQNRIEDQGTNGLYVTKREKVKVKKNASDVGLKKPNPKDRAQRNSYIYVTKIQRDADGKALRNALPTNKYGIKVVQVTIDDFKPESKLKEFVDRKKTQIAKRQTLIEEQENERQSAVTAELRGNRQRVEARQVMLKEKDAAVIGAQKKVELEQKEADLQVVRKKKDLDVAKMEKQIQRAKSESTVFQAIAIKAKGLAEAEVRKAKYSAYDFKIVKLEVEEKIALAKYAALPNVKVEMPATVMMGGSNGGSLDELTNLTIIDKIGSITPKAAAK